MPEHYPDKIEELHLTLEEFISNFLPGELAIAYDTAESRILDHLHEAILQFMGDVAGRHRLSFRRGEASDFVFDSASYTLRISERVLEPHLLEIALLKESEPVPHDDWDVEKISLESRGRYGEIRLYIPAKISHLTVGMAKLIHELMMSGYLWLEEYVKRKLDEIHGDTADELYSIIRRTLPSKLANEVLLYAITDRKGVYIPSRFHTAKIGTVKRDRKIVDKRSSLEMAIQLSTHILDLDQVFAKVIFEIQRPIVMSFGDVEYKETGFHLVEREVYQSDEIVSQPLVSEGRILLAAAYPPEVRADVENVLWRKQRDFLQVLERQFSIRKQMMKVLARRRSSLAISSELVASMGSFIGGLVRGYFR